MCLYPHTLPWWARKALRALSPPLPMEKLTLKGRWMLGLRPRSSNYVRKTKDLSPISGVQASVGTRAVVPWERATPDGEEKHGGLPFTSRKDRQTGRGVARKTTSTGLSPLLMQKLYFENRQKSVQSYKYARFKIYVYKYWQKFNHNSTVHGSCY